MNEAIKATIRRKNAEDRSATKKEMAEALKALRSDKGVTLQEVAEAVGITQEALKAYESGERIPHDRLKIKLCNYYEVKLEAVF